MNPCLTCGACCANFRVSFYWAEADPFLGGAVPVELTERISATRVAMQGTNGADPRCVALEGNVGCGVACRIYDQRPSPCREFEVGSEACLRARRAKGLPDFTTPPVAA